MSIISKWTAVLRSEIERCAVYFRKTYLLSVDESTMIPNLDK